MLLFTLSESQMIEKEKPPDNQSSLPEARRTDSVDQPKIVNPLKNVFDTALERARQIGKKYSEESSQEQEEK
jgi:hypothetical protein